MRGRGGDWRGLPIHSCGVLQWGSFLYTDPRPRWQVQASLQKRRPVTCQPAVDVVSFAVRRYQNQTCSGRAGDGPSHPAMMLPHPQAGPDCPDPLNSASQLQVQLQTALSGVLGAWKPPHYVGLVAAAANEGCGLGVHTNGATWPVLPVPSCGGRPSQPCQQLHSSEASSHQLVTNNR